MLAWIESLKTAGIFLTIAELILHLVPNAEYEKYVRYLLDLCILIVLFWPLINQESRTELTETFQTLTQSGEVWMSEEQILLDSFEIANPETVSNIINDYEEKNRMEGSVSDGEAMEAITGE